MWKSTSLAMTTTPQLIIGGTAAIIDVSNASISDPVVVQLRAVTNAVVLQGSNAAVGAAPALFTLSTATNDPVELRCVATEQLFAATTVAGGSLMILGQRQNSA